MGIGPLLQGFLPTSLFRRLRELTCIQSYCWQVAKPEFHSSSNHQVSPCVRYCHRLWGFEPLWSKSKSLPLVYTSHWFPVCEMWEVTGMKDRDDTSVGLGLPFLLKGRAAVAGRTFEWRGPPRACLTSCGSTASMSPAGKITWVSETPSCKKVRNSLRKRVRSVWWY